MARSDGVTSEVMVAGSRCSHHGGGTRGVVRTAFGFS